MLKKVATGFILSLVLIPSVFAFDHNHAPWNELLQKHVHWINQGVASQVDYVGMQRDEKLLQAYLDELSAVYWSDFSRWDKPQQLAFLINAYNAFTVKLILSKYPDLQSIKDLGSFFSSPWGKSFFTLLGKPRSLDEIEHQMIRAPGAFDDPRIHAAVVCASIGCPGLRDEAFVAGRLDQQLEDSLRRFLSDRSRNRYDVQHERLEISKIFDWYADDFASGFRGYDSLAAFLGGYAELLADEENARQRIAAGQVLIEFLDYDWALNDLQR
ncbi:MAG: DUF547 domain-containing protein [Desulfuromonadales bacterium]|nr:DUF547 domain-containing protein [Desulfuromonadales bacterium]